MGNITDDDIEKEVGVILQMCTTGHRNIVQILDNGWFRSGSIYFIDMYLCALNLDDYIYRKNEYPPRAFALLNEPSFVVESSSTRSKLRNIWTIIDNIAQGLEFMHEKHYIHRDLKPMNSTPVNIDRSLTLVLYSRDDGYWKIADFGLTTEGTSKRKITTVYSKGTEGYRAPELLLDNPTFSNKVDIWAVGCILYELVTCERAFTRDRYVQEFIESPSPLNVSNPVFPESIVTHISECIHEMLVREPHHRPRISNLCSLFRSYRAILSPAILQTDEDITSIAQYQHWKKFVNNKSEVLSDLFRDTSDSGKSMKKEKIIQFLASLVSEFPSQRKWRERLDEWYEDLDSTIVMRQTNLRGNSSDDTMQEKPEVATQVDGETLMKPLANIEIYNQTQNPSPALQSGSPYVHFGDSDSEDYTKFDIQQFSQQLRMDPEFDLKLNEEGRKLLFKGALSTQATVGGWKAGSNIIQLFLFDHLLVLVKTKVLNKHVMYRKVLAFGN